MITSKKLLYGTFFCVVLALNACKAKNAEAPAKASIPTQDMVEKNTNSTVSTAANNSFDLQSVPRTTAALPAFPYVDYPAKLDESYHHNVTDTQFDKAYIIAGNEMRAVEGRVSLRTFPHNTLNMSALASQRNYEDMIKSIGGVKVNKFQPSDDAFVKQQGGDIEAVFKKLRLGYAGTNFQGGGVTSYDVYLIRTDKTSIWIAVATFDDGINTSLLVIEEKALEQNVGLIKADTMASSLQQQGHIALYLSFDTDSDVIRPDSAPVVDEIVKLLRADSTLKLKVQGHTDNVGDAAHNKTLSLARAQSVVKAITAQKIEESRLTAAGMGAEHPLTDNSTENGRAKNRRVELVKS
ncbi:OmpA family protein [Undibacterium sp. Jales W-56]|uniref:OmpA family protein n=1 Tax=Undibacterium sp. Jales W-56 TaxID=2897325 RepID=UPI0021CE886A|nr:OmpA family protein [Undibacterium sp. Jales W-56]MCU6434416.1 OmpA family protein [Undibacterium sp. Jales W-56]